MSQFPGVISMWRETNSPHSGAGTREGGGGEITETHPMVQLLTRIVALLQCNKEEKRVTIGISNRHDSRLALKMDGQR